MMRFHPERYNLQFNMQVIEMSSERPVILVPIDFETASNAALNAAFELSAPLSATIVALHVQESMIAGPAEFPTSLVEREAIDSTRIEDEARLQALCARFAGIEPMLCAGEPKTEIVRVIRERMPILVIMGTHGRTGLARLLMGSVAEYVISHSPVPVMTLRAASS